MWTSLINSTANFLTNEAFIRKKKEELDNNYARQQDYALKRLNEAASVFNRNYYRNYLETPSARNMLKQVREQMNEQSRAMRNTAVITGAAPQVVASAVQNANNKALDKAIGTMSVADAQNKHRYLVNYEDTRNRLNDYLEGALANYYDQNLALRGEHYENVKQVLPLYIEAGLGILNSLYHDISEGTFSNYEEEQ